MPSRSIDLRSDTMTRPSQGMRGAMASAKVGDDVWGEDPTAIELQQRVAELLDKEAALFVPSGTMANQIALMVHTQPGDEVLLGWGSHCTNFESGAAGALAGVQAREVGQDGLFSADDLRAALQPANIHFPPTSLIWLENTHNRGGGRVFPLAAIREITEVAAEHQLCTHLDGARLLNAATAAGAKVSELVASVDSTSICLSKGLGAPLGSVLAGSNEFIAQALRYRKMLGGAMRQVGIVAAAGLYALDNNIARLTEDHANAQVIAEGIASTTGISLVCAPETNIVLFDVTAADQDGAGFIQRCAAAGVLLSQIDQRRIRAVTHLDLDREQCASAAKTIGRCAS